MDIGVVCGVVFLAALGGWMPPDGPGVPAVAPAHEPAPPSTAPRLDLIADRGREQVYEFANFPPGSGAALYRTAGVSSGDVTGKPAAPATPGGPMTMTVSARREGVFAYTLVVQSRDRSAFVARRGTLVNLRWTVESFALGAGEGVPTPEAFADAWAGGPRATMVRGDLAMDLGNGSPEDLALPAGPGGAGPKPARVGLPTDRFGMRAVAPAAMTPGRYRVTVEADEGVRVSIGRLADDALPVVIDGWKPGGEDGPGSGTAPEGRRLSGEFDVPEPDRPFGKPGTAGAAGLGPGGTIPMKIVVESYDLSGPSHLRWRVECLRGAPDVDGK